MVQLVCEVAGLTMKSRCLECSVFSRNWEDEKEDRPWNDLNLVAAWMK